MPDHMADVPEEGAVEGIKNQNREKTGKTLVPFATSGMSGIGDSGSNMQALAPGAKVEKGIRFPAGASVQELADWASEWV
mgnify:CR=1 FL=1